MQLATIHKDGVAMDREELFSGLVCMAAPIFVDGEPVAAMSISIPINRCEGQRTEIFKHLLLTEIEKLNEEMRTLHIINVDNFLWGTLRDYNSETPTPHNLQLRAGEKNRDGRIE